MAQLDRRDRVSIAAGVLVLLGMVVLLVALLVMHPLAALVGAGSAGCGTAILAGQRRVARRAVR